MYAKTVTAALAAMLLSVADAHMQLNWPPTCTESDTKSPMNADGSNFPCHGGCTPTGPPLSLQVGQTYNATFNLGSGANTAVHGGGTCQISISRGTSDLTALKDPANWMVIKTFVGGCPSDALLNLDNSVYCPEDAPECVNNMTYTLPAAVPNGDAIWAWSWFNNVGNREMYMNCAPVTISGGSNQPDQLPGMTVANMASVNDCATTAYKNTLPAYPGANVQIESPLNYPTMALAGSCNGGANGDGSSPAQPANGTAQSNSDTTQSANDTAQSDSGTAPADSTVPGVFADGASSAGASSASSSTPSTSAVAAATSSAAPAITPTPASMASTASTASAGACQDGAVACSASGFYCVDSAHFAECNFGCGIPQEMAAGTACENDAVAFAMAMKNRRMRRSIRNV